MKMVLQLDSDNQNEFNIMRDKICHLEKQIKYHEVIYIHLFFVDVY